MAAADRHRMSSRGNLLWHSDSSYKTVPAKYSMLHARRARQLAGGHRRKLSEALLKTLARPDIRDKMLATNIEPFPSDPATFRVFLQRQLQVWKQKVQDPGIEPE